MLKRLCVLSGILILVLSVSTFAAAPKLINFQAHITTKGGTPETGSKSLTFKIYASDTAPTPIWQEPVTVNLDSAGQFSTVLGDITPLNVDFSQPLWLEVEYSGQAFAPRQRLSSVPYALYAITAESVVGGGGGSGQWTISGSDIYNNNSGKVGIGTTSPKNKLDVAGGMVIGSGYAGTQTASSDGLVVQGPVAIGATAEALHYIFIPGGGKPPEVIDLMLGVNGIGGFNGGIFGSIGILSLGKVEMMDDLNVHGGARINGTMEADGGVEFPDGQIQTVAYTGGGGAGVSGTGEANYIPKFTGTNAIGTSEIYESNGNIGIGITTPYRKLDVDGIIRARGDYSAEGRAFTLGDTSDTWSFRRTSPDNNLAIDYYSNFGWHNAMMLLNSNGNVGIGTASLTEKLTVAGTVDALAFKGDGSQLTNLPSSGGVPSLEAVLAQGNISTRDATLGNIIGQTIRTNGGGTAPNTPTGTQAVAMGSGSTASGWNSTAMGAYTTASGPYSTAMGYGTTASNYASTAMGSNTTASGSSSTAMGQNITASGDYSLAAGQFVTAGPAANTIVLGKGVSMDDKLVNNITGSLMIGFDSTIPTLFVGPSAGAGTTGNIGIGTTEPTEKLEVMGWVKFQGGANIGGTVEAHDGVMFPDGIVQRVAYLGEGAGGISTLEADGRYIMNTTEAQNASLHITGSGSIEGKLTVSGTVEAVSITFPNGEGIIDNDQGLRIMDISDQTSYGNFLGQGNSNSTSNTWPYFIGENNKMANDFPGGQQAKASHNLALGYGNELKLNAENESELRVAIGRYNKIGLGGGICIGNNNTTDDNENQFIVGNFDRAIIYAATTEINSDLLTVAGNVGIGTVNPGAKLEVNGNVKIGSASIEASTGKFYGDGSGLTNLPAGGITQETDTLDSVLARGNVSTFDATIGLTTIEASTGNFIGQTIRTSGNGTAPNMPTGNQAVAMGMETTASGDFSTAMGGWTTASGNCSTAMGRSTTASGVGSIAMGQDVNAEGTNSIIIGKGINGGSPLKNSTPNSLAIGFGGTSPILFVSGEATNGKVGIGTTEPGAKLDVAGNIKIADGTQGPGKVLTSDDNGLASWQTAAAGGITQEADPVYSAWNKSTGISITESQISDLKTYMTQEADTLDSVLIRGNTTSNSITVGDLTANNILGQTIKTSGGDTAPNTPTGTQAVAMGNATTASGYASTAMGSYSTASGNSSTAMGNSTAAGPGSSSTAMGTGTTASGNFSTAMGNQTSASGVSSTAMGDHTTASGNRSLAAGQYVTAGPAANTIVLGQGVSDGSRLVNNAPGSLMVGFGGTSPILFVSGEAVNGLVDIGTTEARGNKLSVFGTIETYGAGGIKFPTGTQTIPYTGSSTPTLDAVLAQGGTSTRNATFGNIIGQVIRTNGGGTAPNTPAGTQTVAMGSMTTASGAFSTAMGYLTTASGASSFAVGDQVQASNNAAIAMGASTVASGPDSTAMGAYSTASGQYSTAMGYGTTASGKSSTAMQYNARATADYTLAAGQYVSAEATNSMILGKGQDSNNYLRNSTANSLMVGFGGTSPILFAQGETANGSVGIGTASPAAGYKLDVNGNVKIGSASIEASTGKFYGDGSGLTNLPAGGITQETDTLDTVLARNGVSTRDATVGNLTVGGKATIEANTGNIKTAGNLTLSGANSQIIGQTIRTSGGSNAPLTPTGIQAVAMGTGSQALGQSSVAMGQTTTASGNYSTAMGNDTNASGVSSTAMGYNFTNTTNYSLGIGYNSLDILLNPNGNSWLNADTGNVGIGTTSPGAKLEVNGAVKIHNINDGNGNIILSRTGQGNSYPLRISHQTGYLELRDTDTDFRFKLLDGSTGSAPYTKLFFGNSGGMSSDNTYAAIGLNGDTNLLIAVNPEGMSGPADILFKNGGSATDIMRLKGASGNVGIGTTNPTKKLEVVGTVKATTFEGDGSQLTGISGGITLEADTLDSVLARGSSTTREVTLGGLATIEANTGNIKTAGKITAVGTVDAASYKIAGTTVVAVGADGHENFNAGPNTGSGSTGYYSTYVGDKAGFGATIGSGNTAIGYRSGYSLGAANQSTFLGAYAGTGGGGGDNVGVGYGAAEQITSGTANVLVGRNAGKIVGSGSSNVIMGHWAGYYNAGSNNVSLGRESGGSSSFSNGVVIGYKAGYLLSGANNILVGYQAGDALTSGSNNIVIGYDIDAPSATGSNQLNIGNAIYGNLSTGNVSIGTTESRQKLSVYGTIETYGTGGIKFPDTTIQTTAYTGGGITQEADTLDTVLARGSSTTRSATFDSDGNETTTIGGKLTLSGTLDGQTIKTNGGDTAPNQPTGKQAVAMGSGTTASGNYSTAMGQGTTASWTWATAMGYNTTASNGNSTAMGVNTTASGGGGSTAMGNGTQATQTASTAMGYSTKASGFYSTAMGQSTTASGASSTAMGIGTTASGADGATAMGLYTTAQPYASLAIGRYNVISGTTNSWVASEPLFIIGNGADTNNRANAVTVLKNGNTNVGSDESRNVKLSVYGTIETYGTGGIKFPTGTQTIPYTGAGGGITQEADTLDTVLARGSSTTRSATFDSDGNETTTIGGKLTLSGTLDGQTIKTNGGSSAPNTPTGMQAVAMGAGTTASGPYSTAMGLSTTASVSSAVAMGEGSTASGYQSVAMGDHTTASGNYGSTAMGSWTTASGMGTTAMGYRTTAQPYSSLVIGQYNVVSGTTTSWVTTEPVFVIGNGADESNRSNAVTVLKNGNVGIGTMTPEAMLDVKGTAKIAKTLTAAQDSGVTLTTADFGKTITVNSGSSQTVTLPDIGAGDIGGTFTIVKLNTGTVTVDAVGSDVIADSTAGGGINNASATETFANITIQVAAADKWVVVGGHGTWTTY